MIRYVPIPAAIIYPGEEGTLFAWYNTITDRFIDFGGDHVFESWDDFEEAWQFNQNAPLARYKALFPGLSGLCSLDC